MQNKEVNRKETGERWQQCDDGEVMCCGRPFHTRVAATGKDRSPMVDSWVWCTLQLVLTTK